MSLSDAFFLPMMWCFCALGWLIGHIQGYSRAERLFDTKKRVLVRGHGEANESLYVRPLGLNQLEQAAWVRAITEVECPDQVGSPVFPLPPYKQMRGLETFCCMICGEEPTYTEVCGLCEHDKRGGTVDPTQLT